MTDYDNNLRGVLFKNDDKREGKQDPDYTGNCEVDGVAYWLSAWIKESKTKKNADGKPMKYMSLSLKPKDERRKPKEAVIAIAETPAFDDEIPF
jgi:hypothetical protein